MKAMMIALALCLLGTAAYAEPSAEDRAACGDDYKKFCSIVPEDKVKMIVECLRQNMSKLSKQCQKHMEKQ